MDEYPHTFTVPDMRDGYVTIARALQRHGTPVSPRGVPTREFIDAVIHLLDPHDSLPTDVGRAVNPAIGAVEALQLIGGLSDPALMLKVTPNFGQFMDAGIFHGAYGPRVRPQLDAALTKLKSDRDTRQAVVTLWDPLHDNVPGMHDYPCTVMLQWMIRDDKLIAHTTMRSNDVWWGLAYDVFQFTQLQLTMCNMLGVEPGSYFHHAVSLHLYERDVESVDALHAPRTSAARFVPWWAGLKNFATARRLIEGGAIAYTPTELWYLEQVRERNKTGVRP